MSDHRKKKLDLLCRLREMRVEEARADHVAARAELDERREQADDTENRLKALDVWAGEQLARGTPLHPEVLLQAQLFRGVEKHTLEKQRAAQAESLERTEVARGALSTRFEELSVVERLATRHARAVTHEEIRRGFVALDEAGVQRKLGMKE